MTPLLAQADFRAWSFGHWAIAIVIAAACVAVVVIVLRELKIEIPQWAVAIFWVVVIAFVAIVALKFLLSL